MKTENLKTPQKAHKILKIKIRELKAKLKIPKDR